MVCRCAMGIGGTLMYHDEPRYYLRIWSPRFNMFVNGCEFLSASMALNDAIAFWEKKHPEKRIRIDLSPKYSGDEYEILYQSEKIHQLSFFDDI